jgi:small subunit ribosomal protein S5
MTKIEGIKENKIEEIAEGEVLEIIEEEVKKKEPTPKETVLSSWNPKTKLGREVKDGKIKNIDEILDGKQKILEEQIVDSLLDIKSDLISIGQSKGKFGGGKRRAWRQTQRKTQEGNVPTFSTMAVIGDENGHVGIGDGKSKETLPARDKALRKAKLNIIKVKRTCASFDCACSEPHTVPFKVSGKSGSIRVFLIPAPQGTGLVVANELKKVLKLAGIKDVYSKTFGKQRTSFNLIKACINALKETNLQK